MTPSEFWFKVRRGRICVILDEHDRLLGARWHAYDGAAMVELEPRRESEASTSRSESEPSSSTVPADVIRKNQEDQ